MPRRLWRSSKEEKIPRAKRSTAKWHEWRKNCGRRLQARRRTRGKWRRPCCKSSKRGRASVSSVIASGRAGRECRESTHSRTKFKRSFSKHSVLLRWQSSTHEPAGLPSWVLSPHSQSGPTDARERFAIELRRSQLASFPGSLYPRFLYGTPRSRSPNYWLRTWNRPGHRPAFCKRRRRRVSDGAHGEGT